MRTDGFANYGGCSLWAAINWSHSSLPATAVHCTVSWWPSTSILIYPHPIACCILFLQHPVLRTFSKCVSQVIFQVAALALSWCTNCCLHCCWVPVGGTVDEAPVGRLNSYPLPPCLGVCGAMTCVCGRGEEDDKEEVGSPEEYILIFDSKSNV